MKKQYEDDDGRTVADMSSVPDTSIMGLITGRRAAEHLRNRERKVKGKSVSMDKEERRLYIFGALRASLLVGFIFLAAFAAVIVLMLWIFGVL